MTLISKLKALLGLDGGRETDRGTTVRVEREPAAESERAVTESPGPSATDPTRSAADDVADPADDAPAAAGLDAGGTAAASVEDVVDEAEEQAVEESSIEESAVEEPSTGVPDEPAPEGSDEPVDALAGIGPAYAERLAGAGVETVGDLAAADAAELDAATDIGEGRLAGWIERARES